MQPVLLRAFLGWSWEWLCRTLTWLCCAGPRWERPEAKSKGFVGKLMVELGFLPLTHLSSGGFSLLRAWDDFWGRPGSAPPCWRNLAKSARVWGSNLCGRKLNFAHTKKVRKTLSQGNFSILSNHFFKYQLYKMLVLTVFSVWKTSVSFFLLKMLAFCYDTSKSAPFWTCLAKDFYI